MTEFYLSLLFAASLLLLAPVGRGQRIKGVSWFEIVHEMHGSSKKSKGRLQQKRQPRR